MRSKICCCCCNQDKKTQPSIESNRYRGPPPQPVTLQPIPQITINSKTFEEEYLEEHNKLRALHGCPPLKLNLKLSEYAAEWAKTLAERNTFVEHRPNAEYGENIFVARQYKILDAAMIVGSWYDGRSLYDFSKPGYTFGSNNFTQIVWKNTEEMGIALEEREGNAWIVVNYNPKGNIVGQFEENVLKPVEVLV